MNKHAGYLAGFIFLVLFSAGFLCSGSSTVQPQITITAVDCPVDSIQITANAVKNNATNNWVVTLTVNVKCNGRNIPNAEIKVTYLYVDYKLTTNASGDILKRFAPATGDPTGNTVNITLKGAGDSEKKADITVK